MPIAVRFDRVSIVFGDDPDRALPLMDEGRSRAEIRDLRGTRRTGAFVGELLGERTQRRSMLERPGQRQRVPPRTQALEFGARRIRNRMRRGRGGHGDPARDSDATSRRQSRNCAMRRRISR